MVHALQRFLELSGGSMSGYQNYRQEGLLPFAGLGGQEIYDPSQIRWEKDDIDAFVSVDSQRVGGTMASPSGWVVPLDEDDLTPEEDPPDDPVDWDGDAFGDKWWGTQVPTAGVGVIARPGIMGGAVAGLKDYVGYNDVLAGVRDVGRGIDWFGDTLRYGSYLGGNPKSGGSEGNAMTQQGGLQGMDNETAKRLGFKYWR